MLTVVFNRTAIIAAILLAAICALVPGALARPDNGTPAETVISNRAEATYEDESGSSFSTVSSTVTVTVLAVSTLTVTPDETQSSAGVSPHESITRLFRVCNGGNTPDLYTITRAEVNAPARLVNLYFDNDADGAVTTADTLVRVNESLSPRVRPGSCTGVLAVVETNDAAAQSLVTIGLSARSNVIAAANGKAEDDGTIINVVGAGPRLTSAENPSLPPTKLVNASAQAVVSPGSPFTYTISFRNSGDVTARNVLLSDELPQGIDYVAGSLRLEERGLTDAADADEGQLSGRRLEVRLAQVVPDQVVRISFMARLNGSAPAGVGVVNEAALSADNASAIKSTTAVVIVDPFGMVFAGRGGGNAPVAGARVELLLDQSGTNHLQLQPGAGFSPNARNENPFATDAAGHFSFALLPGQLGTGGAAAHYFMKVTAAGYVTRMLDFTLRPASAGLFALTVRALDGQPLARAGSFELVNEDVQLDNLAAIVLNVPMFEQRGLGITKMADKPRAEIGDVVTYRIEVSNPTAVEVRDMIVRDRLPESFHYVPGSARISGASPATVAIEPEVNGGELLFRVGTLGHGSTVRLLYRVRIGANAHEGQQENLAVASGLFPTGESSETAPARASVLVGGGAFSTRQILLGRVFEDVNGNGEFDAGDQPMPGVRLYLNSGQSVVTDSQGLYNFPALGDGSQVISLDPVSLPASMALTDGGSIAGRSWTRLLRTPLGGGGMLRQNFALISTGKARRNSPETSSTGDTKSLSAGQAGSLYDASAVSSALSSAATLSAATRGGAETNAQQVRASYPGPAPAGRPSAAGTYEMASTEALEAVAPGEVRILTPSANAVVMAPAMQLDARVMLNWSVRLEVNGTLISEKNIGTSSLDQKNSISTYTFVGISLRPGPNRLRVTAINPAGAPGRTEELTVMGRGPARRLEIVPEATEIQAGGRGSTAVRLRAFDQWGNPALDDQVAVESSLGQLLRVNDTVAEAGARRTGRDGAGTLAGVAEQASPAQAGQARSQLIVQLENGEAVFKLASAGAPGEARLHAQTGQTEATSGVRIVAELRPAILVGLAEMTVGKAVPEVGLRGEEGSVRSRLSFFYNGRLWGDSMLTLAYDSQRPINRAAGRDRLFQLDPQERAYPLFGDSSTRYEAAQSNSKLYARIDRGRSYAMFGDYEADMEGLTLTGYTRKLTGVKLHVENASGDFVTLTGARPDTSFARDVFPGGTLGLVRLSHDEILPGSETVALELRDRRNPEVILHRETLVRSVDYNLNPVSGELFFLRYISTFDYALNLLQIVVTYEHRAGGMTSTVYTGRALKNFQGIGLKLGLSAVMQRETDFGSFVLGGIDGEKTLPNRGTLRFAYARSQGKLMRGAEAFGGSADTEHNGDAYQLELMQPLPFYGSVLHARYSNASEGFSNPFGATVTPGSRRGELSLDIKPGSKSTLRLGMVNERNRTANVDNSRTTFSAGWDQVINDRVRLHFGFDHRGFFDERADRSVNSNLVTVGAEMRLTDKLEVSVKREQNLGEADPTYPTQTTLAATYQFNNWTKFFLTQRLSSAPITPIGDLTRTGFAYSGARRETAIGVETQFGKYTAATGRYQLENGINGTDSFAVIGLQNRLPISEQLSLELGFERGFHLAGAGESFNSATLGFGWQPNEDFRASARYEFRDRSGMGQLISLGAAGRISRSITAMSRFQWSRAEFEGRGNSALEGMAALAIRPLSDDRAGLLFSYTHRSLMQGGVDGLEATRDRLDSVSADGYFQATDDLELYGRFALRFSANGQADLPYVSALTYMTQGRLQYRLTTRLDWAGEARLLMQPSSGTQRSIYGTELGFWALPDVRLGVGYNFTLAGEPDSNRLLPARRGFYFTISSKLSNLFNLFGTPRAGLVGASEGQQQQQSGESK
ncbi:MAG TPA: hypothetical protein VF723_17425 [Pyrinomonadaceae bacterium]